MVYVNRKRPTIGDYAVSGYRIGKQLYPYAKSAYQYYRKYSNSQGQSSSSRPVYNSPPPNYDMANNGKRKVDMPFQNVRKMVKSIALPDGTPDRINSMNVRRYTAQTSRSRGFLKMRRQPAKRKQKGSWAKNGIVGTYEHGTVLQNQDLVIAGHATGPRDLIIQYAFLAILKRLLMKAGIRVRSCLDSLSAGPQALTAGTIFQFYFYSDPASTAESSTTHNFAIGQTIGDIAATFVARISDGTDRTHLIPLRMTMYSNTNADSQVVDLQQGTLYFKIKSSMKLQNRSVNSTGSASDPTGSTEDVDNVPIYGKSIGGNGTGCEALFPNSASPAQIVCSLSNGTIDKSTIAGNLLEPLSGFFFPKSKTQGKVHLDPGEIKTSRLYTQRAIRLGTLFKMYYQFSSTPVLCSFGKFCFFQLEKMIDTGVAINILLAYETNYEINCYYKDRNTYVTAPLYSKF